MSGVLYLALRHIAYHRLRSATLVLVVTTLMTIPLLAEVLSRAAETRMMARAQATPLVYGAAGAPLDLTLAAAYFRGDIETPISMQDYDWLLATRQAEDLLRQGVPGIHFYTLNRSEPTLRIWENLGLPRQDAAPQPRSGVQARQ